MTAPPPIASNPLRRAAPRRPSGTSCGPLFYHPAVSGPVHGRCRLGRDVSVYLLYLGKNNTIGLRILTTGPNDALSSKAKRYQRQAYAGLLAHAPPFCVVQAHQVHVHHSTSVAGLNGEITDGPK
jgi:hypothetical protein